MPRLRQKAISCGFDNVDEAIRDQIIAKCRSMHLRRKFLDKSGNILLKDLQDVTRAFEAVDLQMKAMENRRASTDAQINVVNKNKPNWKGKGKDSVTGRTTSHRQTEQRCYRCNRKGRVTHSVLHATRCVNSVGSVVTMQCVVKHRSGKPTWKTSDTTNPKVKTCYKVTGNRQGENRDDYAFTVDNTENESGVVEKKWSWCGLLLRKAN